MARTRVRIASLLALTTALALTAGCGGSSDASSKDDGHSHDGAPVVVATTTWEGAFAKAAGAKDVKVIVPQSVQHAPDYDPKPSDLAAVADADFVLYAPFEPYAEKIKAAATMWQKGFGAQYGGLQRELKAAWPGGKAPSVVTQVFTAWSAKMAGAQVVGTYGPEAVSAKQLSELSAKKPALVLDNAHMSTGTVLPDSGAKQVKIVNFPGKDLDLLPVYRDAASALKAALAKP